MQGKIVPKILCQFPSLFAMTLFIFDSVILHGHKSLQDAHFLYIFHRIPKIFVLQMRDLVL